MTDALVALNQTWQGEVVANVLGFSNTAEDEDWLQDFADEIATHWGTYMENVLSAEHSLDNITVSFIDGDHISYSVDVPFTGGPVVGTDPADVTASQNALLVSLHYIGARPNRGRIYFCGYTEGDMLDGIWQNSPLAAAGDFTEAMQSGVGPGGELAFLRIIGRPNAERPNYVSSPVSTILPRGRIATQRRRRLG